MLVLTQQFIQGNDNSWTDTMLTTILTYCTTTVSGSTDDLYIDSISIATCWVILASELMIIVYSKAADFLRVSTTQSSISLDRPGRILDWFRYINSLQPRFGLSTEWKKLQCVRHGNGSWYLVLSKWSSNQHSKMWQRVLCLNTPEW